MHCLKCQTQLLTDDHSHYGLHPKCFMEWFNISDLAEFISLRPHTVSDKSENQTLYNTSFFHGKFKKYSAMLNDESYILKMRQEDAPELPEVEYLCNQIGHLLGVNLAKFYFIDFNGDRTFVTKNFISPGEPINLQHIYHYIDNHQHNFEWLLRVITQETRNFHDIKMFIRTVLFDALIGNHDRHGRNLAFIITAKNTSLSPIYDNVSYLSLERGDMLKADFNPTGKISTKATLEPSMRDYVKELKRLGYQYDLDVFYRSIRLQIILNLIDNSFCSPLMKTAIKNLINKRFKELEDELSN